MRGVCMEDGESVYMKKKIVCPKCGYSHEISIRTNLSMNGFYVNANCVSCGAPLSVDQNSVFRNTRISSTSSSAGSGGDTKSGSFGLESLDDDSSSSSHESFQSNSESHNDISAFFEDESTSSKAINDLFG